MCYSILVRKTITDIQKRYGAMAVKNTVPDYALHSVSDSKQFPPLSSRVYPGHFASVFFKELGQMQVELMRYGTYPPIDGAQARKYTSFNARSDNLRSHFWSNAFMHHHGFVIVTAFFEWVSVRDLLKAGKVGLGEVEASFQRQQEERKTRILASGKKYKPTPTELKSALDRQIIIQFTPEDGSDLVVPVIFSRNPDQLIESGFNAGFAIITDDPPPEIKNAGHDRCPVIFESGAELEWLNLEAKNAHDFEVLLARRRRTYFRHQLPDVA